MRAGLRMTAVLLAAAVLVPAAAGCGGSPSGTSAASGVTCTSYPIHGAGPFSDEVQVRANVTNATAAPADYQADVILTLAGQGAAGGQVHVLVSGLVAAGASAVLSRKVLVASKARDCKLGKVSRS